jgi:triosephosphate isomerase
MRRTLIVGNWKMNGSLAVNATLLANLKVECSSSSLSHGKTQSKVDVAVCVPVPYLFQAHAALKGSAIELGAQDVSMHEVGAYTGEIAASMLNDFDCSLVIVGHSERRGYHGETDDVVACKALAALSHSIIPIVCVGETLEEREAGLSESVVCHQLDTVLKAIPLADMKRIMIAYEPIWAIGTGKTATPQVAQDIHALLRSRVAYKDASTANTIQILYGGSMKSDNAAALLSMPDIDGGLIGGAALNANDFAAIVHALL